MVGANEPSYMKLKGSPGDWMNVWPDEPCDLQSRGQVFQSCEPGEPPVGEWMRSQKSHVSCDPGGIPVVQAISTIIVHER